MRFILSSLLTLVTLAFAGWLALIVWAIWPFLGVT